MKLPALARWVSRFTHPTEESERDGEPPRPVDPRLDEVVVFARSSDLGEDNDGRLVVVMVVVTTKAEPKPTMGDISSSRMAAFIVRYLFFA